MAGIRFGDTSREMYSGCDLRVRSGRGQMYEKDSVIVEMRTGRKRDKVVRLKMSHQTTAKVIGLLAAALTRENSN